MVFGQNWALVVPLGPSHVDFFWHFNHILKHCASSIYAQICLFHMYCAVLEALLQVTTQRIQQNPDTNCCSLPLPPYFAFFSFMQKRPVVFTYTSALIYIYILTFKTVPWSLLGISLTTLALRNKSEMRKRPKKHTMALLKTSWAQEKCIR